MQTRSNLWTFLLRIRLNELPIILPYLPKPHVVNSTYCSSQFCVADTRASFPFHRIASAASSINYTHSHGGPWKALFQNLRHCSPEIEVTTQNSESKKRQIKKISPVSDIDTETYSCVRKKLHWEFRSSTKVHGVRFQSSRLCLARL
jgi:hypothetical protein